MGIKDKLRGRWSRRAIFVALASALLVGGGAYYYFGSSAESAAKASGDGQRGPGGRRGERPGSRPQPIKASEVRAGNLDIVLSALGTVTASNTATVKPRVDGQLVRIAFREGQQVKAGDLLAEIDPRPFQIALEQVSGQLLKDEALLAAAKVDLERYRALLAKDSIARQQVDTQEALVRQYRGVVESDKALVDNARLQLGFTRITAPAGGRLGLRLVDVGNNVRASDATGLVVITQTQPIHAVFAIPADAITAVVQRLNQGETLEVEAWDRDGRSRLTRGKLLSVDNQVDVATGTVKLKAEFANRDNSLFPNQFVNIRLKQETRSNSLLLASAAVQRNAEGSYVYLIDPESQSVTPRPVKLGPSNGEFVAVENGLKAGDQVVSDGADRLKPGSKVEILSLDGKPVADSGRAPAGEGKREEGGQRKRDGENARSAEAAAAAPAAAPASGSDSQRNESRGERRKNAENAPAPQAAAEQPAQAGGDGENRGRRRCAPENVASDPELAARCERWRQRREAEGGGAPREGGRRGE